MTGSFSALMVAAALAAGPQSGELKFDNYTTAWNVARAEKLPMLVVINPGPRESARASLASLEQASVRRSLLQRYVIVEIDGGSPHGAVVGRLFKAQSLPMVAIVDREQKVQLYKSSQPLSLEDWNIVLYKYRTGDYVPPPVKPATDYSNCPSCMQAAVRY